MPKKARAADCDVYVHVTILPRTIAVVALFHSVGLSALAQPVATATPAPSGRRCRLTTASPAPASPESCRPLGAASPTNRTTNDGIGL
jgi:hypothetical protein